jgi:Asp-tRNA(Asn)/Glu-tRNA(Gln) amidotransferase B subunit
MTTSIHINEIGAMLTVTIRSTAMGSNITASLSSTYLYANIDGLLWWVIDQKLNSLVSTAMDELPTDRNQRIEYGHALSDGQQLTMDIFTTPFFETTEERQDRIVRAVSKHLPELAPLTRYGSHAELAKAELAELMELCGILRDRIAHSGEAMHGIAHIATRQTAQAA